MTIAWLSCSCNIASARPAIQQANSTDAVKPARYKPVERCRQGSKIQKRGNANSVPHVPDATGIYPVYAPEAMNRMMRRMSAAGTREAPAQRTKRDGGRFTRPASRVPRVGRVPSAPLCRSACHQAPDRRQAQVLLAQAGDFFLELAEQSGHVAECRECPLQQRAPSGGAARAAAARGELGAALSGDAIIVRGDGPLLPAGLGRQAAEGFGAADLLLRDQLLHLLEYLGADAAAL